LEEGGVFDVGRAIVDTATPVAIDLLSSIIVCRFGFIAVPTTMELIGLQILCPVLSL